MADAFKTGGNCDAWCTKCKMDLAHTIVAMVDRVPVQVICNTCGGFHKYRRPKSAPAVKSTRARTPGTSKPRTPKVVITTAEDARQRWTEAMAGRTEVNVRRYNVREEYVTNELIDHPKFGRGVIVEALPPNKVKALFSNAEKKILIMCYGRR